MRAWSGRVHRNDRLERGLGLKPQQRVIQYHAFTTRASPLARKLITEVQVCVAFDPKNPPPHDPTYVPVRALWDTGASSSVIAKSLVAKLGLASIGQTQVHHGGDAGVSACSTYLVNFLLPNNVGIAGVLVAEFNPQHADFEALVGMDIITRGDFSVTHVGGNQTCMSFRIPSCREIDYVQEANVSNARIPVRGLGVGRNDPCPCGRQRDDGGGAMKFKHCHGK